MEINIYNAFSELHACIVNNDVDGYKNKVAELVIVYRTLLDKQNKLDFEGFQKGIQKSYHKLVTIQRYDLASILLRQFFLVFVHSDLSIFINRIAKYNSLPDELAENLLLMVTKAIHQVDNLRFHTTVQTIVKRLGKFFLPENILLILTNFLAANSLTWDHGRDLLPLLFKLLVVEEEHFTVIFKLANRQNCSVVFDIAQTEGLLSAGDILNFLAESQVLAFSELSSLLPTDNLSELPADSLKQVEYRFRCEFDILAKILAQTITDCDIDYDKKLIALDQGAQINIGSYFEFVISYPRSFDSLIELINTSSTSTTRLRYKKVLLELGILDS